MIAGKPKVLYVDDEPSNLTVFRSTFRRDFTVQLASSAREGLEIIQSEPHISVIVTDQRMPEMTGVEMLAQARDISPDSIRIILTAYTDVNDIIAAINEGHIYRFITKPWQEEDLRVTIQRAAETYTLKEVNKQLQEELIRAEKLAGVGKMASAIGHEIRNQLTFGMAAELIQRRYPDDVKVTNYTRMILDARDHILRLLDDIRNYARENRKGLYHKSSRNLSETLVRVLESAKLDQEIKHLDFINEIEDCGEVLCDHQRIGQVLLNLIRNAGHASQPDGQILIRLRNGSDKAVIEVHDFGCGIPEENIQRIWEPFYSTKGDRGLGLGLDICRKIIEDHQGKISCKSAVGEGTIFQIELPIHES